MRLSSAALAICTVSLLLGRAQGFYLFPPTQRAKKAPRTMIESLGIRGGAILPLQDFSAATAGLFGNIRVPAALVAGAGITIGYANASPPNDSDLPRVAMLKKLNALLAMACLSTELIAVLWSTIEVNKLYEISHAPTQSLMELLKRDYALSWLGTNIHFIVGLFMLMPMTAIFVWVNMGPGLGKVAVLGSVSTVCFMGSVVNHGVARGDGTTRFAGSFAALFVRYLKLLAAHASHNKMPLLGASLVSGLAALYSTFSHLAEEKNLVVAAIEDTKSAS